MMTDLLFTRWLTLKIAKRQLTSISLDRLASNLPDEAVKHTSEVFKDNKFKHTKKKGAYPYDYINSVTKFDEKLLEKIYSNIQDEDISDEVQTFSKCMEYIQSQYYGWISWSVFEVWYSFAWWCLKISERPVYSITTVIHVIILHLQDSLGMQFLKWLTLNWNLRQTLIGYEKGMCGGITHFQPTCKSKQQIHEQPQCWRTIKIYRVWMPIICMDGQWVNIFQLVLLNDWVKKKFNMQT